VAEKRILIEGVGGIGGVVAAKMIRAGLSPTLVTGNPDITKAINSNGLDLTASDQEFIVPARAFTSLDDVPKGPALDAAYLLMKANTVIDAARQTLPLLGPDGYVVTFQNGIVEDSVAEVVGRDRVVSAVVGWGAEMRSPGVYHKTSGGKTFVGELDGKLSHRVMDLGLILKTSADVIVSPNIRGVLWSKLAINSMITTVGALTGERLGVLLRRRRARAILLAIYREAIDTARAMGITLEPVAVRPELFYLARDANVFSRWLKHLVMRAVGLKYGKVKSSRLQSLERGRKTEIDYLNGYVVQKAKETGVAVPTNEAVVRLVKEIEEGKRSIDPTNLREIHHS
jgi:2-dehydropantoate 2-reductase